MAQEQGESVDGQHSIVLFRYTINPDLFCGSPWACRLDALLTLSGTSFSYAPSMASNLKSKTGRIPYLVLRSTADSADQGEMLCDSERAYDELVKRGMAKEMDVALTPHERATSRLLDALIKQLVWALEKERWVDNYTFGRDRLMSKLFWPIRMLAGYYVYRTVSAKLNAIEIGTLSAEEHYQLITSGLDAIVTLLMGEDGKAKTCILGRERPTRTDALVLAPLVAALRSPIWNPIFAKAIRDRPILVAYAETVRKTWWPKRPSLDEQ